MGRGLPHSARLARRRSLWSDILFTVCLDRRGPQYARYPAPRTPHKRNAFQQKNQHGSSTSDSELHCLWLHMVWQPQIRRIWGWLRGSWSFAIPKPSTGSGGALRLRLPPGIEPCQKIAFFTLTALDANGRVVPRPELDLVSMFTEEPCSPGVNPAGELCHGWK